VNILLCDLGSLRKEYNEPLSIEVIAGLLVDLFPSCHVDLKWFIKDETWLNLDEIEKYKIIGVSLNLGTLDRFDALYQAVQRLAEPPLIILGNVIPTFAYESILKTYKDVICIRGEGEFAFSRIVQLVAENNLCLEGLLGISNLAFVDKGDTYTTERCCTDLSNLKLPSRRFCDWLKSNMGIVRIEGSRGCAWGRCRFCSVREKYGTSTWRPFPIDYIIEDLAKLSQAGLLSPYFTDEDFFGNDYLRAEELADAIIDSKSRGHISSEMNFFVSAAVKNITSEECQVALGKLKQAGLREVFVGLEAGSEKQLQRFGKGVNADINIKAVEILSSHGFEIDLGYILFEPFQTFDDLKMNVDYLKKLDAYNYNARPFKKLRIQPHTDLKSDCEQVITSTLNINDLSYSYEFVDSNVREVCRLFEVWETNNKQDIYYLQASTRGEMTRSSDREKMKKVLEGIRKIDLTMLEIIIDYVDKKLPKPNYLETVSFYQEKRDLLVESGLQLREL